MKEKNPKHNELKEEKNISFNKNNYKQNQLSLGINSRLGKNPKIGIKNKHSDKKNKSWKKFLKNLENLHKENSYEKNKDCENNNIYKKDNEHIVGLQKLVNKNFYGIEI